MSDIIEFECVPQKCLYNTEEFKVYRIDVDLYKFPDIKPNKNNNITISGNFHNLAISVKYTVKATETNDKHGIGYKVSNIRRDKPQTVESSRVFLSEILTYTQVNSILNAYPDIIDKVIKNDLDDIDLSKTPYIKDATFDVIKRKIVENFCLIELIDKFNGLLEMSVLRKLHEKYPSVQKIVSELRSEPYKCLCGLARTSFKTADKILLDLDKASKKLIEEGNEPIIDFGCDLKTSKQREKACIMFCLEEEQKNGNTKMGIKELRLKCKTLAPACIEHFVDVVKNDEHIYFDMKSKVVALKSTYNIELFIADKIKEGLNSSIKWNFELDKYKDNGLTDEQFSVLSMLCNNNIMILNGFSGAGKSFTTQTVLEMLNDNHKSYKIFSPTGRAAKVISNYCKYPASTIHRGLEFRPPNKWGYNKEFPLYSDVIIVDEVSMIDIYIMQKLLDAINFSKTKLLIIGDSAQIPSINAGNILHDMMSSKIIQTVTLTKIFRYGVGGLQTVATNTRESKKFLSDTGKVEIFGEDKGYIFIPTTQAAIVNKLVQLYKKLLSDGFKADDIWVLSAYNKGQYGSVNINSKLQVLANSKSMFTKGMTIGEITFYKDDLVLNTSNNYKAKLYNDIENHESDLQDEEKEVFIPNGEVGRIIKITDISMIINFDGLTVIYDKSEVIKLKLAYSISTHKSQGGQSKIVIILTPKAHSQMLNSNLIYVGQTRAQLKCYHLGDVTTVNRAIKEKVNFNRNTFLLELLQNNNQQIKL